MDSKLISIDYGSLNADLYQYFHKEVGFKEYEYLDIEKAMEKNLYDLVVYVNEVPAGCIRVLGDDSLVFFIKDVIVIPEFREYKVGYLLMYEALKYIKKTGCKGAYIGLMSTVGKESFYEKFGFITRPNSEYGSGMVMFNE